jgi:hypothetical protein
MYQVSSKQKSKSMSYTASLSSPVIGGTKHEDKQFRQSHAPTVVPVGSKTRKQIKECAGDRIEAKDEASTPAALCMKEALNNCRAQRFGEMQR